MQDKSVHKIQDKPMKCVDCGQEFVWTVGEQEFYASKKVEDPKYCMICRGKHGAHRQFEKKYLKD